MPNKTGNIIIITAIATSAVVASVAWAFWPEQAQPPAVSVESIIAQGKFNGADLVMQSAYTVCPSKYRKYMIAFRGRVHYFIDTKSSPLSVIESPPNSGHWEVTAPAITLDSGFTSDIDKNGKSWRRAWVLDGAKFVDDTTKANNELKLLDNYALHTAYRRLVKTDEIKSMFTEQVAQFVGGVLAGAQKNVKSMTVTFAPTPKLNLPPVEIDFCEDDNGISVKP